MLSAAWLAHEAEQVFARKIGQRTKGVKERGAFRDPAAAQPWIVERGLAKARLDRVLTDIPQHVEKVCVVFDCLAPKAILKQVSMQLILPVVIVHIGCADSPENQFQRILRFLQEQVNVIPHQAICKEPKSVFCFCAEQRVKESPAIRVVQEQKSPVRASDHDVIKSGSGPRSCSPWHWGFPPFRRLFE